MAQMQKKFIAPNAVDDTKIRLSNNATLRARNAADSGDVSILKVDASDLIQMSSFFQTPASAPTNNYDVANKKYVDDSVSAGSFIHVDGSVPFTGDQSMGGHKLTNLADPTSNGDAVSLSYMNARLNGIKPKAAVRAATTVAGTLASSFANGSVIDTVTLATGDRILIKNQATASENGIYVVAASGAPTRAADFDSTSPIDEINGAWVAVQEGGQAGQIWVQFGTVTTVGTDSITFEYFNAIAGLIGGDMITFSGSTFSVDLATVSGLESSNPGNVSGQLRVKLEASNPSLQIDGSNQLGAKLDAAGAITSGASGLKVGVDNSTIEINTNALRVKDAGITLAKLASNSVDENKIVSTAISTTGALNGGGGTKLSVRVDSATTKINGSNNLESLKQLEQKITLSGTDITNQFVDLAHAIYGADAANNSAMVYVVGGPMQEKAVDYTVSLTGGSGGVTRITFAGDLATGGAAALIAGDKLVISYSYLT